MRLWRRTLREMGSKSAAGLVDWTRPAVVDPVEVEETLLWRARCWKMVDLVEVEDTVFAVALVWRARLEVRCRPALARLALHC